MRIGIIDAELIDGKRHRFPNLACMKLSAYHKARGDDVELLTEYDPKQIYTFDVIYISCVFTDTAKKIGSRWLTEPSIKIGGTGFFYDKYDDAPMLDGIDPGIEHIMPDYSLYDVWVDTQQIWQCPQCKETTTSQEVKGKRKNLPKVVRCKKCSEKEKPVKLVKQKPTELKYYTDFSIGFTTRGCPRGCEFCVNRNSKGSKHVAWADEFFDPGRKKICLLDDNLLACQQSDVILRGLIRKCELENTCFEYKQGLDMRLMTEEKAELLGRAPYCGDFIFAFDNPADRKHIERGLQIFRKHAPNRQAKFFVFCGYSDTTEVDVTTVFERTRILWNYGALSYVMRHENYKTADPLNNGMYTQLARWCNQPAYQKKLTFRVFCNRSKGKSAQVMNEFEAKHPDIAAKYFDMCYPEGGSAYLDPAYKDEWNQPLVSVS